MTPAELARFERQIFYEPNTGCWLWGGALMSGYGTMSIRRGGRKMTPRTHVLAWEHFRGSHDGLWVLHRCDVPACCNPDHLFLGTALDNVSDMLLKGRHRVQYGEQHYIAKLTEDAVREIRQSSETRNVLAARFGVSRPTINDAIWRKTWKHVQ